MRMEGFLAFGSNFWVALIGSQGHVRLTRGWKGEARHRHWKLEGETFCVAHNWCFRWNHIVLFANRWPSHLHLLVEIFQFRDSLIQNPCLVWHRKNRAPVPQTPAAETHKESFPINRDSLCMSLQAIQLQREERIAKDALSTSCTPFLKIHVCIYFSYEATWDKLVLVKLLYMTKGSFKNGWCLKV